MDILISACLLGAPCRYSGDGLWLAEADELMAAGHHLVPVCPEQLGGLATPRAPAERVGDRVLTRDGQDVTEAYRRGGACAAALARRLGCGCALLKARSPSCGSGVIYDGTFSGVRVSGHGVAAERLNAVGIPVFDEEHVKELWAFLAGEERE